MVEPIPVVKSRIKSSLFAIETALVVVFFIFGVTGNKYHEKHFIKNWE